jgi:hypothetical protein
MVIVTSCGTAITPAVATIISRLDLQSGNLRTFVTTGAQTRCWNTGAVYNPLTQTAIFVDSGSGSVLPMSLVADSFNNGPETIAPAFGLRNGLASVVNTDTQQVYYTGTTSAFQEANDLGIWTSCMDTGVLQQLNPPVPNTVVATGTVWDAVLDTGSAFLWVLTDNGIARVPTPASTMCVANQQPSFVLSTPPNGPPPARDTTTRSATNIGVTIAIIIILCLLLVVVLFSIVRFAVVTRRNRALHAPPPPQAGVPGPVPVPQPSGTRPYDEGSGMEPEAQRQARKEGRQVFEDEA